MPFDVSVRDVYLARQSIAPWVLQTPVIETLERDHGFKAYLKLENLQRTGSFKVRGAFNKLLSLDEEARARGVIAVTTGNHGRAVAYAARVLGLQAVICLSKDTVASKVEAIRRLGAEIVEAGESYDEAVEVAFDLRRRRGLAMIHPFDDPRVIAGQGTLGLELLEQIPQVDAILVPLSGGGLAAGVGVAVKATDPGIRLIGVSMVRGPVMIESLKAGHPLTLPEEKTLADALVGGIGEGNQHTFRMCHELVDETVLVSEDEIAAAMAFAYREHHVVVEGGGAVGLAALLSGKCEAYEESVAVVVSGGNVAVATLAKAMLGEIESMEI